MLNQASPITDLPQGFVYLKSIDPTIIENLRYYLEENFIGNRLPGYNANKAIMTKAAAIALSNIQQELQKDGYSMVVYDAYRPRRAVEEFIRWRSDLSNQVNKEKYYPHLTKEEIFKHGYVVEKSYHSKGSTVDITIIKAGQQLKPITITKRKLEDGTIIPFLDDGTVDMGSSFDLFGRASNHDSSLIAAEYLQNRNYLRAKMVNNGFEECKEEWWHYTLKNEPFPTTYFDFIVE